MPPGWTPQGPVLWDYRVEPFGGTPQAMQAHLQRLGAEGWELVSAQVGGAWQSGGAHGSPIGVAILKRPYVGSTQPR